MDLSKITKKWHEKWDKDKIFKAEKGKDNFYVLEMFPYPSGHGLHMGHAFNYTIGDIQARFRRMQGYNVLYPMGFDSFGLPAENAAIKNKSHPKKFTESAIKNYKKQMKGLSLSYDWDRTLETHTPEYYKWDQWIFLKMFEKGLVYKKKAPVNWCNKCNTVLANEQVHNGYCWRHEDEEVEVKYLDQWYIKTTAYADELYEGIDQLEDWPDVIKSMQRNWIGKSQGASVLFKIKDEYWSVFTTRPDTLYGVTFLVISAQHEDLEKFVTEEKKDDLEKLRKKIHSTKQEDLEHMEKEGFFTGTYAEHPLTKEKIPVYAGNFVLADYGSGMVMAVPGHDQRDFDFAKKYDVEIKQVVSKDGKEHKLKQAYTDEGILVNSEGYSGMNSEEAKEEIVKKLEEEKLGSKSTSYKLKDWLISRQRFWGTPIPMVHCKECGDVPVREEDLPVKLPEDIVFESEKNPLVEHEDFISVLCPSCGGEGKRETDTMDTFVNSSWYYLRYTDPKNEELPFSKEEANKWCPVDLYIGGKEHACMHLIYIRFYTKFLRDIGLLNFNEPAVKLFNQGMLQASDGGKMSKSKGNIVLPEAVYEETGLDPARFFLVSVASPDKDINWSDEGLQGAVKFLNKITNYFENVEIRESSNKVKSKLNKAIRDIEKHYENLEYNFATIKIRELFESFEEEIAREDLESFLKIINPIVPHLSEELWEKLGNKTYLALEKWPEYKEELIDEKSEFLEKVKESVKKDFKQVVTLTGIENPGKATIVVSPEWKYEFMSILREEMNKTWNQGEITKKVMNTHLKQYGNEVVKLVQSCLKNPEKVPGQEITQEEEYSLLKDNKEELEKEFNCKVEIEMAEHSDSTKKKSALPAKPALIVE